MAKYLLFSIHFTIVNIENIFHQKVMMFTGFDKILYVLWWLMKESCSMC